MLKFLQPLSACLTISIRKLVTVLLLTPIPSLSSVHSSREEETENDGDGAGLHISVGDGRPAQRDGRCHAGAGGRTATEVDGPREGNAEQSNESAGGHA